MKKIYIIFLIMNLIFFTACISTKEKILIKTEKDNENKTFEKKEEFIFINKGSFVYEKIETHLNSFFITKDKIFIKDKYLNKLNFFEIVEYCNKRSMTEGLIPYYNIKNGKIYENVNNNGYRLPTKEEYVYLINYSINNLYTIYPKKDLITFDLSNNQYKSYLDNFDCLELFNEDLISKKNKNYSGFRLVKKDKISNSCGIKYTTRKEYDFKESYEIYYDKNYGIKFLYPKDWGISYIDKNMDNNKRVNYKKIEIGDSNIKRGIVFYEINYNSERIYTQKFFVYKNNNFNLYNKKGFRNKEEILKEISKKFNLNINNLNIFIKNEKAYIYLDEEIDNGNIFLFIVDKNNIFEISFETINEYTKVPESIILNIFNSVEFFL